VHTSILNVIDGFNVLSVHVHFCVCCVFINIFEYYHSPLEDNKCFIRDNYVGYTSLIFLTDSIVAIEGDELKTKRGFEINH